VLEKRCDVGSDLWSFGCLIYALYHEGRSPVQSRDTVAAYAEAVRAVGSVSYAALPPALAGRHMHPTLNARVCACMYACLRVCVCACMCAACRRRQRVCTRAFLSLCVYVYVSVCARTEARRALGVGSGACAVLVQTMLKPMPEARPMARQLSSAPYFDSLILKALLYMDALPTKPPAEKAQFFRSLPKALPQFPERILAQKVRAHTQTG
jgi:hypothetical protein